MNQTPTASATDITKSRMYGMRVCYSRVSDNHCKPCNSEAANERLRKTSCNLNRESMNPKIPMLFHLVLGDAAHEDPATVPQLAGSEERDMKRVKSTSYRDHCMHATATKIERSDGREREGYASGSPAIALF